MDETKIVTSLDAIHQTLKEILITMKRQVTLFEQYDSQVFETDEFERESLQNRRSPFRT